MGIFGKKKKLESKNKEQAIQNNTETQTVVFQQPTKTKSVAKSKETENPKQTTAINEQDKKPATLKKPIYRVVYNKTSRNWEIKKDGAKRVIATFVTKEESLKRVKELSESKSLGFVVHKKDGKFQKK